MIRYSTINSAQLPKELFIVSLALGLVHSQTVSQCWCNRQETVVLACCFFGSVAASVSHSITHVIILSMLYRVTGRFGGSQLFYQAHQRAPIRGNLLSSGGDKDASTRPCAFIYHRHSVCVKKHFSVPLIAYACGVLVNKLIRYIRFRNISTRSKVGENNVGGKCLYG